MYQASERDIMLSERQVDPWQIWLLCMGVTLCDSRPGAKQVHQIRPPAWQDRLVRDTLSLQTPGLAQLEDEKKIAYKDVTVMS